MTTKAMTYSSPIVEPSHSQTDIHENHTFINKNQYELSCIMKHNIIFNIYRIIIIYKSEFHIVLQANL